MSIQNKVPKYIFLISISILMLIISCSKTTPKPDNKLFTIAGMAILKDYYSNAIDAVPYPNQPVFIRAYAQGNKDTSNYFYSIKTGIDGSFKFYVSDTTIQYEIFTSARIKSSSSFSAGYYGSIITSKPYGYKSYQLNINLDTANQNLLSLITQDVNGERISNARIILYSSKIIATADSSFLGIGSLRQLNTDSLGMALLEQLPVGKIYINALLKFTDSTGLKQKVFETDIALHTITSDTLILK